ncbi:reverse transcriptase [Gossypium australe]|uniref:Reverse transcriptase n=1 Tax=Gossypium australe TaxID=47621 RepID=A0A5B6UV51_9ROSI|nr:reverse transcriptase [Gossypium australe]
MEGSGGEERVLGDEISLLAEELVQLSIKRSLVTPTDKPMLICSDDLEQILEGRPWLFRKYLILFDRLVNPIDRDLICLTSSPFWIKIGPCLSDFDKKDLLYAIGSTFGGVIRSEIHDDLCRLKVVVDVQKPLRRGIFASSGSSVNSGVPFKYEKLPIFCFGCGHMGHGLQDCEIVKLEDKKKIKDDPPFSVALKTKSKAIGKESMKFAAFSKLQQSQSSYTGGSKEGIVGSDTRADPMKFFEILINGRSLSQWEDGLMYKEGDDLVIHGEFSTQMEADKEEVGKKRWRRRQAVQKGDSRISQQVGGKRKFFDNGDYSNFEGGFEMGSGKRTKVDDGLGVVGNEIQTLLNRRLPLGKPTEHNEKPILERPWFGESTGSSKAVLLNQAAQSPFGLLYGDKIG